MAQGYTRNDTANNIADKNIINASDLDGEFDAIQSAFDATTGHTHDGTVGGGAAITAVGPAQEVVATSTALRPKTDNAIDLGTSALEYRDLYLDGTAKIDTLTVDESATIAANLTVNGNTVIGDAATDTLTLNAQVSSPVVPTLDDTYDLGTSTKEWRNLYVDGTAQVDTLQVDESATVTANLTVNGNTTLGNATTDTVTVAAQVASSLVPSVDATHDLGSVDNWWKDLFVTGGANVGTLAATDADIADTLSVGGSATLGGADTDTLTINSQVASSVVPDLDDTYSLGSATNEWKDLYVDGTANIDSLVADTADINGGTVDNVIIGGTTPAAGSFTSAKVTSAGGGNVLLQRDDTAITSGEVLGSVSFQAPNVAGGGNATLVAANIQAVAGETFDATNNSTDLQIQLADNGAAATKVTVKANGNVGIGNTNPGSKLDVAGPAAVRGDIYLPATTEDRALEIGNGRTQNGTSYIDLVGDTTYTDFGLRLIRSGPSSKIEHRGTSDFAITASEAAAITFNTSNLERMRINSDGDVGIGTTIISKPTDFSKFLAIGDSDTGVGQISNNVLALATNSQERMRITSSGSVGIGTISPESKLDVNGSTIVRGDAFVTGSVYINGVVNEDRAIEVGRGRTGSGNSYIDFIGDTTYTDYGLRVIRGPGANAVSQITHRGTGVLAIEALEAGSVSVRTNGDDRMVIDSAGRVGIGTSDPQFKLVVLGGSVAGQNSTVAIKTNNTDGASVLLLGDSAEDTVGELRYDHSSNTMTLRTNNANRVWVNSGGEVRVGSNTDQGTYNIQCNGTGVWGAGAYVNGSDARLKDDVAPIGSCLNVVRALNPVVFRYKPDFSSDQSLQPGFIAQELQEVFAGKPYVEGIVQGGPSYLNVAYQTLIPVLTAALQEADRTIQSLTDRLTVLEATVANLTSGA